ncbi:unnamed protein product [Chrysoparadoxa australica]
MADGYLRHRSNDTLPVPGFKACFDFVTQAMERLTATSQNGMSRAALEALRDAGESMRRLPVASSNDELFIQYLSHWVGQVKSLRAGEVAMSPMGWARSDGTGHIIMVLVRHEADDIFTLAVVNPCGEGSSYHPRRPNPDTGRQEQVQALTLTGIAATKLCDSSWWFLALRPLIYPSDSSGPELLYERLLPYLNTRPLYSNVAAAEAHIAGSEESPVEFVPLPLGGSPSGGRTVYDALLHLLRLFGLTSAETSCVDLMLRWAILQMAEADLGRASHVRTVDVVPLQLASQSLARVAAANSSNPQVSVGQLRAVLQTVKAVHGGADKLWRESWDIAPPELHLPVVPVVPAGATPWAVAFPLFGKLRRDTGVDHLAGDAQPPPIVRPVELTLVPDQVSSFEEVGQALHKAVHVVTLLSNQCLLMEHTYYQRVALISHLFTRVIPIPMPTNHPEAPTKCFWQGASHKMRYETQAHILRHLNLLTRHFVSASLSLAVTSSFDAVRMLTMACIATVTDIVMRTTACDFPSVASMHYSGSAPGPVHPFGFEMGYFGVESEWAKLPDPAHHAVRCQVLDYFTQQRRGLTDDHVLFAFEESMGLGAAEGTFLHQVCLHMGYPEPPEIMPLYLSGEDPLLTDNYPELAYLRDVVYLLKAVMAPTSDALPEVRPWTPQDAALRWKWKGTEEGYHVKGFGRILECAAFVVIDEAEVGRKKANVFRRFTERLGLAKSRAPPSGANPSNLAERPIDTEDDVLFIKNLPDFGGSLPARDVELLLQYLTVPYLRVPLLLQFFADPVRLQSLWSDALQEVLDAALFEPGQWQPEEPPVPSVVPADNRDHLATPCGLLFNELLKSPQVLLSSLEVMLTTALELDTGKFSSTHAPVILYVLRLVVRVEGFILYLHQADRCAQTRGLQASDRDPEKLQLIGHAQLRMRGVLNTVAFPMLERWLAKAADDTASEETCVMYAHVLLLFKNVRDGEFNFEVASATLSAQVWLMVHYRFGLEPGEVGAAGKSRRRSSITETVTRALDVPPTEIFDMLAQHRNKLLRWLQANPQDCNDVMEAVVRIITRTGDRHHASGTDSSFKSRDWKSMARVDCVGRFVPDTELVQGQLAEQESAGKLNISYTEWMRTITQAVDTEINMQLGIYTLKRHGISKLPVHIERHTDFINLFGVASRDGSSSVAACEVTNTTHRTWLRLVGRRHDVQYWDTDTRAPTLPFHRKYNPRAGGSEAWVAEVLEPVRLAHFPDMEIFLPDAHYTEEQTFAHLAGTVVVTVEEGALQGDETDGESLVDNEEDEVKELVVLRDPPAVHVYNILDHGRRFYRSLVFSSDATLCLQHLPPSGVVQDSDSGAHLAAGNPFEPTPTGPSLVITRNLYQEVGVQTFVPERLLRQVGLLPSALLEQYHFWQNSDDSITGVPRFANQARRGHSKTGRSVLVRTPLVETLAAPTNQPSPVVSTAEKQERESLEAAIAGMGSNVSLLRITLFKDKSNDATGMGHSGAFGCIKRVRLNLEPFGQPFDYLWVPFHPPFAHIQRTAAFSHPLELLLSYPCRCSSADASVLPTAPKWSDGESSPQLITDLPGQSWAKQLWQGCSLGSMWSSCRSCGAPAHQPSFCDQVEGVSEEASLLNIFHAPDNSPLKALARCLLRIESASHILAWSTGSPRTPADGGAIDMVELPRLRLTFVAKPAPEPGQVRLFSLEHTGMFLSNRRSSAIERLCEGLPQCLILETLDGDLQLLLPSTSMPARPEVEGLPFSGDLVFSRGDEGWLRSMGNTVRHYLYPVHSSQALLGIPNLAAALYLLLMRFMSRQYDKVFSMVASCITDMPLSSEEEAIFKCLGHLAHDHHPDAVACRLKLSITLGPCVHMRDMCPWSIEEQLVQYIQRLDLVSSTCRLELEEELQVFNLFRGNSCHRLHYKPR